MPTVCVVTVLQRGFGARTTCTLECKAVTYFNHAINSNTIFFAGGRGRYIYHISKQSSTDITSSYVWIRRSVKAQQISLLPISGSDGLQKLNRYHFFLCLDQTVCKSSTDITSSYVGRSVNIHIRIGGGGAAYLFRGMGARKNFAEEQH